MSIFDVTITARNLPRLIKMGMAEEIVKNIDALEAENARLKAEVERLRKDTSMMLSVYFKHSERLRKAGDAMAVMVGHIEVTGDAHRMMLELSKEWEEAKEGKPSV